VQPKLPGLTRRVDFTPHTGYPIRTVRKAMRMMGSCRKKRGRIEAEWIPERRRFKRLSATGADCSTDAELSAAHFT